MRPAAALELVALGAVVAAVWILLGFGAGLLAAGAVLLLVSFAIEDRDPGWPRLRLPRPGRAVTRKPHSGPHPPPPEIDVDASESAYHSALARLAAEARDPDGERLRG